MHATPSIISGVCELEPMMAAARYLRRVHDVRLRRFETKIKQMMWKIDYSELVFINTGTTALVRLIMFTSNASEFQNTHTYTLLLEQFVL